MREKNFWVIGGDRRQAALAALLREEGHTVHTFALGAGDEESLSGLRRADCAVLPLPAVTEGRISAPPGVQAPRVDEVLDAMLSGQLLCAGMADSALKNRAAERGLLLRDYFAREELAVLNAIPTAEGAVRLAMEELPITLHEARVLILGFGRIGKLLVPPLRGLGARVTAAARSAEQRALARAAGICTERPEGLSRWLCGYDLVINTVPALLLGRDELAALKKGALVIDLASRPGGVDFSAAEELGVRCIHALGLPGKTAPVTAGGYIMDTVYHIMEELEL